MIKSKITSALILSAFTALIASCATTKVTNTNSDSVEISVPETTEKVRKEPKSIAVQNTSNQQEKKFRELLTSLEIKVTGQPKQTYSNTAFNSDYSISVTNAEGPVKDLSITVSYPSARTNDTISYNTVQITTDEEGKAVFKPEVPAFAIKDEVTFYPTPVSSNAQIVKAAYDVSVKAPYMVKSSYTKYPFGILYVYDFNESGRPTTNNFTILQSLRNSGVSVGNSPISDTSYFNKPLASLYKANYNIVGNAYNFLVVGSIKYAEPAVEEADSATVKLRAEITCVDMKNGSVLYETSFEETTTDKNKWSADQKCRKVLAEKASRAIIYGM